MALNNKGSVDESIVRPIEIVKQASVSMGMKYKTKIIF